MLDRDLMAIEFEQESQHGCGVDVVIYNHNAQTAGLQNQVVCSLSRYDRFRISQ